MASRPFLDRAHAGRVLAGLLERFRGRDDVLILALPRGGVPVGFEVARALAVPFDVFIVRKLGVPGHEELAFGAIASGGVRVLNQAVVAELGLTETLIDAVTARERRELERREQAYRDGRPPEDVRGKTVLVVDDGLATGATMKAGVSALRSQGPAGIVVAVPVAAAQTCREIEPLVDEIVCAVTPEPFYAVGLWFDDFSATSDDDVRSLLAGQPPERVASFRPLPGDPVD
jgi:predicted phosphoribosyltransferase